MEYFVAYYLGGLMLLVFGGRVKNLQEFLLDFFWAPVWPLVLFVGWLTDAPEHE